MIDVALVVAVVPSTVCTCNVATFRITSRLPSSFLLIRAKLNKVDMMIGIPSNILDYLDDDGEDIDLLAYDDAEKDYLDNKRQLKKPEKFSKKPFKQRKKYFRRNPRDSI